MHPVLLAALAVAGVPLELPPQQALADVAWPTHAVIALARGEIKDDAQLYLVENGRPALAQVEVAARWPDKSPKWVHAHGLFRYAGGKPLAYELDHAVELPAMPASPLAVRDEPDAIRIDTGVIRLTIARPFAGITRIEHAGGVLVEGANSGPSVIDGEGTLWHTRHDPDAKVEIESNGPAMVTVKAVGWYQTPQPRDDAFCRFTTRITAYAGSPIVKIDHATTFADDMKKHAVAELAFTVPLAKASAFSSSTFRGAFSDTVRAAYLAQLTDDRAWRIVQSGPDAEKDIRTRGDFERNPGWFSATIGDARLALMSRDFWQKCPKEVKVSADELVYYAWPKHGALAPEDPDATELWKIYKFQCFHRGKLLTSVLPDKYFKALQEQKDTTECKAEFAQAANLHGASMRNEFALAVVPGSDAQSADAHLEKLQQVFLAEPTARVSPAAMADSGAFGPVAAAGQHPFAQFEDLAVRSMLGYARAIPRYRDYGWAIYGNTHHKEIMNPAAAGVETGRPTLHRVWANNHYQHVSTCWRLWALNGDPRLLVCARAFGDNYASIGQVRFDKKWDREPPGPNRRPSVKYHYPGAFYHCKGLVPWGGRDYGMDKSDVDASLTGHWPDPSALLWAWLLDADRWAKDGYDLWYAEVNPPTGGVAREANQSLVQAINAHQYQPHQKFANAIGGIIKDLARVPLLVQRPGPLWDPTWPSRYHELAPQDKNFQKYLLECANVVGVNDEGLSSIALCATAYGLTKNKEYLLRHAGILERLRRRPFHDPTGRWQDYGNPPGASGDLQFAMQWHRFARALVDAGITQLTPPEEPGTYLGSVTRYDNDGDVAARGTMILMLKSNAATMPLALSGMGLPQADVGPTSLRLLDPAMKPLWRVPRLPMSQGKGQATPRPGGWSGIVESYAAEGPAGLYALVIGSDQSFFQGISPGPECQVLRNEQVPNWREPVRHRVRVTKGWLVPVGKPPLELVFTAAGERDGSYVAVTSQGGAKWERWLVAGSSERLRLDAAQGPWQLDIFGDFSSVTDVVVRSTVPVPLLYGRNLAHVEAIKREISR